MSKLAPHELEIIRDIYTAILDEPWFNRNAVTERELLKLVFRTVSETAQDRETLGRLCREAARNRFSRTT